MKKVKKYSLILFSIVFVSFYISNANAIYVYDGYLEYQEAFPAYHVWEIHPHEYVSRNSSIYYIPVNNTYREILGYSLRNVQLINLTLHVTLYTEDAYPSANQYDVYVGIYVNLYPVYEVTDILEERHVPPQILDEIDIFLTDEGVQNDGYNRYIIVNLTTEGNPLYANYFGIWGFAWFRADYYNYLTNTLVEAVLIFVPTFLVILVFPIIFYDMDKKYGIFIGLFVGTFALKYCNLISYEIMIFLLIGSALITYFYLKSVKRDKFE